MSESKTSFGLQCAQPSTIHYRNMNNLRIFTKLLLLSSISIIILITLGLYGVYNTKTTFQWVSEVYDTTGAIERLFREVGEPINHTRRLSLMTVMAPDEKFQSKLNQERIGLIDQVDGTLENWRNHYITSSAEEMIIRDFQTAWQQYKLLSNLSAEKAIQGYHETAFINTTGVERDQFTKALYNQFSLWLTYRVNNAKQVYAAANDHYFGVRWIATISITLAVFVVLLLSVIIARKIVRPLNRVNEHLKILAQGRLAINDLDYQGSDEIAEIVNSVQQLKNSMMSTISQAHAIASGNFSQEVKFLSDDDQLGLALAKMTHNLRNVVAQINVIAKGNYSLEVSLLSEQDQLGQALANMTQALREAMIQKNTQDWLKMGVAKLNEKLRGELTIVMLAKNAIDFLTTYVNAQIGLFYLLTEDHDQQHSPYLHRVASYAYTPTIQLPDHFQIGEGLVGQAALEKRAMVCAHQIEECIHIIRSGLSQSIPRHVVMMPFLHEEKVLGVIELGSFEELSDLCKEFLDQAMPTVGIAINSAQARGKMLVLLEQSQRQASELQVQQAELQATNEELQSQSEELQTQQEELRQANDELEERARELERQKDAIKSQNVLLEKSRQEVENKAHELEIASKYKSEFLANMSHELRTPLNSLLILAQLLAENKDSNLTQKQVEYANTIHSAGSDLLTLINEVLDLSKIEAGKVEIHQEEVDLGELVSVTLQKFQHLAEKKGIGFTVRMTDKVPKTLYTDGQRLKQIINNLLANAVKFTSQGEVKLEIQRADPHEFRPAVAGASEFLKFSVSDTGIGIPKDKQEVIFEAFQQADGTTSRRYGGTGLGLTISRQLVRLLGGEITLHSEMGQGSTFTIYLPITVPGERGKLSRTGMSERNMADRIEESSSTPVISKQNMNAVSSSAIWSRSTPDPLPDDRDNLQPQDRILLIVEDDRKFSRTLLELAHDRDFKCLIAEDGKTGLQMALSYKPDAIILDIGLPEIDGWTVMERLKDNPATRHIPVHFISAFDQNKDARKMGAVGCLLKPVGMEELSGAFKKIEHFVGTSLRHLLVFVDQDSRRHTILELVENQGIQTTVAKTQTEVYHHLQQQEFDCFIVDVESERGTSLQLLEPLCKQERWSNIPVIVYAERELTTSEEAIIHHCENNLTIKSVRSPERLLDEATLFLHQLEANLPKEKQKMLARVHDKQAMLTGKKVLLADDDVRNTFALMTFLDSQGMEVIVANNGKEALQLLEEHSQVDIVLMDIMMPEMDGYETMQKIRLQSRFRHLPIIALTAKAMKGDKAKCIEAGANDYITKPVDTEKLVYLMRVWLYR